MPLLIESNALDQRKIQYDTVNASFEGRKRRTMSVAESRQSGSEIQNAIPITSLSIPELRTLREKLDVEVQRLQTSKLQLQRVLNAFHASNAAITKLSQSKQGDEMLLPLTGSLYVTGQVASVEHVLLDVGTGYFVERSTSDAIDYCKRKATYLTQNIQQLGQVLTEKQKALGMISHVLDSKLHQEATQQTSVE